MLIERRAAGIVLIAALCGAIFLPSAPMAVSAETGPRMVTARASGGEKISLDGRLDERAWNRAAFASGFIQALPNEGEPSDYGTEVGFLYDEDALYVGARLQHENSENIRSTVARRDNTGNSERIIVTLDTYHDRRTSYSFCVTASGVRADYYHPSDHEGSRDYSWDPVWEARTDVNGAGWTAEMRIPFSQLRFSDHREQVWGINMNRWTPAENEDSYWVQIPREENGWASRFAELHGIEGIRPTRRIELMPYFAGEAKLSDHVDSDDPFRDGEEFNGRAGGDLKMGLGPNLTLDATFNPDFGQVEADPAEVNLSAFETFFDEKRPFFIEGSQLLRGDGANFYYSRRIGARPHGDVDGEFVDVPQNTTIAGAAKVSGRFAGGTSIGLLAAMTPEETGEGFDDSTGEISRSTVEPRTGFGVLRLQQEFGDHQSTAGLSLTSVSRDFNGADELESALTEHAVAGGADWRLRYQGGKYLLGGSAGFSHIKGDSSAILAQQRSSRRYFQRPDAGHVEVDSNRTSLSGYQYSLFFEKNSGEHWLWGAGTSGESPQFEINDAGRLSSADDIEYWGNVIYRETRPGRLFRRWNLRINGNEGRNFDGIKTNRTGSINWDATLPNFWNFWTGTWRGRKALSDHLTRGGPLMETLEGWSVWFGMQNNWASDTFWSTNLHYVRDELNTWNLQLEFDLRFKPGSRWEIGVEPEYSQASDGRQYITTLERGAGSSRPDATFGNRYIFSWIERSTLSSQFRLNYSLTPDLSIEAYAEPFVSSARFFDYGELERQGGGNVLQYGEDGTTEVVRNGDGSRTVTDEDEVFELDNDDFNVFSFRSNVVLRWEWRRGSTLFLVWQQNRSGSEDHGSLVGGEDLIDSFRADGEDLIALKMSYWFPVY